MQPGEDAATAGAAVANGAPAADMEVKNRGRGEEIGGGAPAADMEVESRGEEIGGGSAGNRWPRRETVALLKIRSDMDALFRVTNHKGLLWEEVSRKMAELGYHRSSKKCKEKFENVFKYHKRTKEGRSGKADGKTYRYFNELEAFEANLLSPPDTSGLRFQPVVEAAVPLAMAMPASPPRLLPPPPPKTTTTTNLPQVTVPLLTEPNSNQNPPPENGNNMNFPGSPSGTPTLSSSSASDGEVLGKKRKRKWKDFFEQLAMDVMRKQEDLHKKFLEAIDKRENEKRVREEAWKAQELARLQREHEVLVQERSMAAAKDAALIALLQKLSEKEQIPLPPAIADPHPPPAPVIAHTNGDPATPVVSSRWPKAEVEALIRLRTGMEQNDDETGPKGLMWEEMSAAMRRLGYNRNAKKCKEKWENINKYYRRMKESNRKRKEDSKTCPYYNLLEALHQEKNGGGAKPAAVAHESQWPPEPEGDNNMDQDDDSEEEEENEDEGLEIVGNTSNGGGAAAAVGSN